MGGLTDNIYCLIDHASSSGLYSSVFSSFYKSYSSSSSSSSSYNFYLFSSSSFYSGIYSFS